MTNHKQGMTTRNKKKRTKQSVVKLKTSHFIAEFLQIKGIEAGINTVIEDIKVMHNVI